MSTRPLRRQRLIEERQKALEITQMYPTFFAKTNSNVRLPNETILEILEQVPGRYIVNAMCACKSMHLMGARVLYTTVKVEANLARLYCTTIASRTNLSTIYASFTRDFSFHSISRYAKFILFPMFCETLLCLQNLRRLSICIAPGDATFMHACLLRYGIMRDRNFEFESQSNTTQITYPDPSLPILDSLRIGGEPSLLGIANFRNLTDLTITSTLSLDGVDGALQILRNQACGSLITSLALRLEHDVNIISVLHAIASSTKNLKILTLEKYPIDPICVLSSMEQSLPTIRTLLLNRFARRGPCSTPRTMSVQDFDSIVKQKLESITDRKHSLSFVCFGPTLWARHYNDRSWSTDINENIIRWWSNGLGAMQRSDMQHDHRPVFRGTPWTGC